MILCLLLPSLLVATLCQSCETLNFISDKYNSPASSFMKAFAYAQCNNHQDYLNKFNNQATIGALNPCILKYLTNQIDIVETKYNQIVTVDVLDDMARNAYQSCYRGNFPNIDPFCGMQDQDKKTYLLMTLNNSDSNSLQHWFSISYQITLLDRSTISEYAQQQADNLSSLLAFIEKKFVSWIPQESYCPWRTALAFHNYLVGSYNDLSKLIANREDLSEIENSIRQSSVSALTTACRNWTNEIIQNQTDVFISMSSCAPILMENVTIRNNIGLSFAFTSTSIVLRNVTIFNNTFYKNQYRALFMLTSISCNMEYLNVTLYTGKSLLILNDGSIAISYSTFQNITIDSTYSYTYGTISMTRGSISLSYCSFNNITGERGGGIYMQDGSLAVNYCVFSNINSTFGGGIYIANGNTAVYLTKFYNIKATFGPAIYGIYCSAMLTSITTRSCKSNHGSLYFLKSSVNITQSQIQNNSAINGAGLYLAYSDARVETNNIFSANTANEYSALDGFASNAQILDHNIFQNNKQLNSSSIGLALSNYEIDTSNQFINQKIESSCGDYCISCNFDNINLILVCLSCQSGYHLDQGSCIADVKNNPINPGMIVLFIFCILFFIGGGYWIFRRYKMKRQKKQAEAESLITDRT